MKCLNGFRFTTDIFVTLVINKKTKYEYTLFYQLQTPWTSKSNCFLEKDFLVLLMISLGEEIKNTETFHCDFSFPLKHWELNIKKKLLIYFFLEHYITDQRSFHNFLAVQFYSVRCLSCVRLFQSHNPPQQILLSPSYSWAEPCWPKKKSRRHGPWAVRAPERSESVVQPWVQGGALNAHGRCVEVLCKLHDCACALCGRKAAPQPTLQPTPCF